MKYKLIGKKSKNEEYKHIGLFDNFSKAVDFCDYLKKRERYTHIIALGYKTV